MTLLTFNRVKSAIRTRLYERGSFHSLTRHAQILQRSTFQVINILVHLFMTPARRFNNDSIVTIIIAYIQTLDRNAPYHQHSLTL